MFDGRWLWLPAIAIASILGGDLEISRFGALLRASSLAKYFSNASFSNFAPGQKDRPHRLRPLRQCYVVMTLPPLNAVTAPEIFG